MDPVAGSTKPTSAAPPAAPAEGQKVDPGPWRCAADPSVETYLRCGRCEKPICPRCLIATPVGSRCRDCAQLRRLPMFVLGPVDYLKAIGAGLGSAILAGIVLARVLHLVPFLGFLRFFLMAGFGYVVGEAVSRLTGNKQGNILGIIAGLAVVVGAIVGQAVFYIANGANPMLALSVAFATAVFQIWSLLGLVVAAAVAFSRAR
jgi:hypothetical protein